MTRQLSVVLALALAVLPGIAKANNSDFSSDHASSHIQLAQAQLSSYPVLKAKLRASLDAIEAKLAEPENYRLKRELDNSLARIEQLKVSYFNTRDKKHLSAFVSEYKKVKFKLKPLTDALAPLMEAPLDVLDTIKEYESPNLVVDWAEVNSMTANYNKMVMQFADADSMVNSITENSDNYVNTKISQGEPISISLYDEADRNAVEQYLKSK